MASTAGRTTASKTRQRMFARVRKEKKKMISAFEENTVFFTTPHKNFAFLSISQNTVFTTHHCTNFPARCSFFCAFCANFFGANGDFRASDLVLNILSLI